MAAAHDHWLKQVCAAMCGIKKCAAAIAAMSLTDASMAAQLPRMNMLSQIMAAVLDKAPTRAEQPYVYPQPAFELVVTDFTLLLNTLMPQLNRLGLRLSITASSIGTSEEKVFWELWTFLMVGCSAFGLACGSRCTLLPLQTQPFFADLYAAYDALLRWLLSISQSAAWLAMKSQHGLHRRNCELLVILAQPLHCLLSISFVESRFIIFSHLACFPSTALPLLCCITTEQFTDPLFDAPQQPAGSKATSYTRHGEFSYLTPLYPFLDSHIMLIANLSSVETSNERCWKLPFLKHPAVIHFLKTVLILPRTATSSEPNLLLRCLTSLDFLFGLYYLDIKFAACVLPSTLNASLNRDALGLPLHINPRSSMQVLNTDARLLHALTAHLQADPSLTRVCYAVQLLVMKSWLLAGRVILMPAQALSVMATSVCGLAKMCTAQGLHLMQQVQQAQKRKLDKAQKLGKMDRSLGTGKQRTLHSHAQVVNSAGVDPLIPSLEVMTLVRTIMYLTWNFQTQLQDFNLHPASSEHINHFITRK